MVRTKIEWCDAVWNPVVGCTGACPYCYARKMAHRFHRDFTPHWEERNFQRAMPRKPSRIFVNSMSDVADWGDEWYVPVWKRMTDHPEHLFLFLSKRPWKCSWSPLPNAMLGYSVTKQYDLAELSLMSQPIDFLSIEPLLGPIALRSVYLRGLRWIIVGAETGNRRERVVPELAWLQGIYDFACGNRIPLFFKDSLRRLWPGELPREFPAIASPRPSPPPDVAPG